MNFRGGLIFKFATVGSARGAWFALSSSLGEGDLLIDTWSGPAAFMVILSRSNRFISWKLESVSWCFGHGGWFGQAHLFAGGGRERNGPDQGHVHANVKSQKRQKKTNY